MHPNSVNEMSSFVDIVSLVLLGASRCSATVNLINALSSISSRPISNTVNHKGFVEIAAEDGYQAEAHEVTTEDGYILTVHRIPAAGSCPKRYPVLIVPGLLQPSESFLDAGADAPGYIISKECFDVWIANVRGTFSSRRHETLDPDTDLAFWKFSAHEMGAYDVPSITDYILHKTGARKLIYVGYSQGGACFFVANSERPEYADKISLFVGLAPGSRLMHSKSVPLRLVAEAFNALQVELEAAGVWEILSKGFPIQGALGLLCQVKLLAAIVCGLATSLDSPHPDSITPDILRRAFEHAPAGTSVQNFAYCGQLTKAERFLKFDHGAEENLKLYGTSKPPSYDVAASKAPALIFSGPADHIVDVKDVQWAVDQLPNVLEYVQVEDPLWNHLDMTYSRYWNRTIFVRMKNYLIKYGSIGV